MPPRRVRRGRAPAAAPARANLDDFFPNLDGKTVNYGGVPFRLLRTDDGTYVATKRIPDAELKTLSTWMEQNSPYNPANPNATFPSDRIFNDQKGNG